MAITPSHSAKRTPLTSRNLHRWVSIAAAVLFLLVSVTGVFLQLDQITGEDEAAKEALAAAVSPATLGSPLALDARSLDRARASVLARFGNRPVAGVDWQIKGPTPRYVFHLEGADPLRVEADAASGKVLDSKPDGEGWLHKLHTGEIIGDGGKFLGLAWGLGLVFMVLSGVWMYVKMYRARQRGSAALATGWRRWFW